MQKGGGDFPQDLKNGTFPFTDQSGLIHQGEVISDQLSDAQLLKKAELAGSLATKSTAQLKYAQEVFYWVPLHLALQLQQARQYAAALGWFHSVYAYTLPHDNRKVYAALLPEQVSSTYTRTERWLVDLNPHAVAKTRAYPYTRFVLLSLTRCMLDYADAQFTSGTLASMGRARELYLLALELLDQPELQDGQPQNPSSSATSVAPNPAFSALRQHAAANLATIRGGRNIAGMRYQPGSFSLREDFADAWYDLRNPDQSNTPMTVRFRTGLEDFPSNVEKPAIEAILLYFSRRDGQTFEVPTLHPLFTPQGSIASVGDNQQTQSSDGIISTRRRNGTPWRPIVGKAPAGE